MPIVILNLSQIELKMVRCSASTELPTLLNSLQLSPTSLKRGRRSVGGIFTLCKSAKTRARRGVFGANAREMTHGVGLGVRNCERSLVQVHVHAIARACFYAGGHESESDSARCYSIHVPLNLTHSLSRDTICLSRL